MDMDRIFRILNEEIEINRQGIKYWSNPEQPPISSSQIPKEVAEKNVFGFECQLQTCLSLREKMFGIAVNS